MPTDDDRNAIEEAIKNKNQEQIRALLQRDDVKKLLLMTNDSGYLPIHDACRLRLDKACLQLILDAGVQHKVAKEMLEQDDEYGSCLYFACGNNLSLDSLRLLLEYLLKHADIKKVLEEKTTGGTTCLHFALASDLSVDSLRLLLEYLLKHADIKKMLEEKDADGYTCLQLACHYNLSSNSFHLLLEYLSKHADIKRVLEEKTDNGSTCLNLACANALSVDSLRLLLGYLAKHADIKKMLEEKSQGWPNAGSTCLHLACRNNLSPDALRLLLEYLSKHADIKKVLEEKDSNRQTCLHLIYLHSASTGYVSLLISFFPSKDFFTHVLDNPDRLPTSSGTYLIKKLFRDPECFEKCRLWLLLNHQDTFLYSLFPNSFEKTCDALKELTKNGLQETPEQSTIMLIAVMSSPSKFREAIDKTTTSAPMSSYFDVVKKGDKKSDYNHWRKNINRFRDFYGQWPSTERKTASTFEGEGDSSCSIQ